MRHRFPLLLVFGAILIPLPCAAQNVSNYGTIPEPFLFLLREPAVQEDLGLSREQQSQLVELNQQFDGELLSTRNMPADKGQEKVAQIMAASRALVAKTFTPEQQERLRQITHRLRGISFVLTPHAAKQLSLSAEQRDQIESIVQKKTDKIKSLQKQLYDGEITQGDAERTSKRALANEQRKVIDVLDAEQKRRLTALVGRAFDSSRLGEVSFKAPELSESGVWINSDGLQLSQLRGNVIALHFWAFG